MTKKLQKLL